MSKPALGEAAPETHRFDVVALLFGASAAPIAWLGHVMLGYGVTAYICYPADHPVMTRNGILLRSALVGFDIVAVVIALAGGLTALWCLERARAEQDDNAHHRLTEGRNRFLALWGLFSSLCFLIAILFNIIASLTVPLCSA